MPGGGLGAFIPGMGLIFYPGENYKEGSRSMKDAAGITKIGDWVVRQRIPDEEGPHRLLLLLHGWTGDENSMWIFTPRLPGDYLIIAPRGITHTPMGGYGWERKGVENWPTAPDFDESVDGLLKLVASLSFPGLDNGKFNLMGFSQGAALAYTMILKHPERIDKLAGLSGFLPRGLEDEIAQKSLADKHLFVAHGRNDELVSIEKARETVRNLKIAGSEVNYCEEDIGHKLSAGCFRALDNYF